MLLGNESIFILRWIQMTKSIKNYKFDVNLIKENSSDGYILQVNFEYPNELYEMHIDYLLAPEKLDISYNKLSN